MLEYLNANPGLSAIIGLIVGIATIGAVQWKVLTALYVKPRDFELESLKRRVDELSRSQFRSEESARESSILQLEDPTRSSATTISHQITLTSETGPLNNEDPFQSLEAFYRLTHDPNLTELQKRSVAEKTLGIEVTWTARVRSVNESDDGYYDVFMAPALHSAADAFCRFAPSYVGSIAKLKRGHMIKVRGTIRSVRGFVSLSDCELLYSEADG